MSNLYEPFGFPYMFVDLFFLYILTCSRQTLIYFHVKSRSHFFQRLWKNILEYLLKRMLNEKRDEKWSNSCLYSDKSHENYIDLQKLIVGVTMMYPMVMMLRKNLMIGKHLIKSKVVQLCSMLRARLQTLIQFLFLKHKIV